MVQVPERIAVPPRPASPPAPRTLTLRWFPLLIAAIVLAGFLLRIYRLADRAIHHDESLHSLYSWYLYTGRGYVHGPMMHGPWQFHFAALVYFLFGDSDSAPRFAKVLFGACLIPIPHFVRPQLRRTGTVVASVLLAISPAFLYFSPFAREDSYFAGWCGLLIVGLFGMIRTHRERYIYVAA